MSLEPKRAVVHFGLPFDSAARRCARFSLVFCIVFPFAVLAVLPVIGTRWASLLQAILSCVPSDPYALSTNRNDPLTCHPICWGLHSLAGF